MQFVWLVLTSSTLLWQDHCRWQSRYLQNSVFPNTKPWSRGSRIVSVAIPSFWSPSDVSDVKHCRSSSPGCVISFLPLSALCRHCPCFEDTVRTLQTVSGFLDGASILRVYLDACESARWVSFYSLALLQVIDLTARGGCLKAAIR